MSEIDVSKCEYLEYELEEDGNYYYFCKIAPKGTDEQCHNFNDCYYKQLQQLKQENEELKQELELYKNQSPLAVKAFVTGYRSYKKQAEENYELWQRAEKVLDEIEKIIEECNANSGCYDTCEYYDLCNCDTDSFILNIIKQAKEGE